MSPGYVGDIRESCHLEVQATSVELAQSVCTLALVSERIHKVQVILAVQLGGFCVVENDLCINCCQESPNAYCPAIL
jgi:hypothetical protein